MNSEHYVQNTHLALCVCVCVPVLIDLSQTWYMLQWWHSKHTQVINQFSITRRVHAVSFYRHRCDHHTHSKFQLRFIHWRGTTIFQKNSDLRFRVVSLWVPLVCSFTFCEYTELTQQIHRKIGHGIIAHVLHCSQLPSRSVFIFTDEADDWSQCCNILLLGSIVCCDSLVDIIKRMYPKWLTQENQKYII